MDKLSSAFPKLSFSQCIDLEIFHESEQESLTQFSCPINLGVFSDPVCVPCCGNTFCKQCIIEWISLKKHCPTCRKPLAPENLGQPVLMVKNLIMAKKVICKNKSRGCPWSDNLEKLYWHFERDCEYNEFPCTYCGTKILKNELNLHEENCERKPKPCQYCKNTILLKNMEEHEEVCDLKDVACDKCEKIYKRREIPSHRLQDCPEFLVDCRASLHGCKLQFKRRDKDNMDDHCLKDHKDILLNITFNEFPKLLQRLSDLETKFSKLEYNRRDHGSKMREDLNILASQLKMKLINDKTFLTQEDLCLIKFWLNDNGPVELVQLWQSNLYNISLEEFHQRCDEKGPTVFVVKTQLGYVLGGYTSMSWKSADNINYKTFFDVNSFMFSLTMKQKFPLKKRDTHNIFSGRQYGPSFTNSLFLFNKKAEENLLADKDTNLYDLSGVQGDVGQSILGLTTKVKGNNNFYLFRIEEVEIFSVKM